MPTETQGVAINRTRVARLPSPVTRRFGRDIRMLESGCAARPRGIFTVFVISNKAGSYARININNVSVRERLIQSSPGRCGIFGNHRTFRHCWNIHVLSVTRTECRPHIPRFSKTSSRCIPPWGGGEGPRRGISSGVPVVRSFACGSFPLEDGRTAPTRRTPY